MMTTKPKPSAKRFTVFTLNIGNTHTRLIGWGTGKPDSAVWKTNSKPSNLSALLKANGIPGAPIILAGVVPAYKEMLAAALRTSGRAVHIFRRDLKPRIKIVPKPPERVGDDRLAAALGALVLDKTCPWVVVDVGTAMTINAVRPGSKSKPPRFEGGLIVPSATTSLRALNHFTAQLPQTERHRISRRDPFIGRNTEDAMVLGVYHAQFAAAVALTQGQLKELGPRARAVITGGGANFAPAFCIALNRCAVSVEDLVHLGLYAAWQQSERSHG